MTAAITEDGDTIVVPLGPALSAVVSERIAQDVKWGEQNHPDGTGLGDRDRLGAELARNECQRTATNGTVTWRHILTEEVAEAYAEQDPDLLREELAQVAAVAIAWIEAIDRRTATDEADE